MQFVVRERDSFEERNHSSTALINFNPALELPSLDKSAIADMLVQQRPAHRTPNMNIRPSAGSGSSRTCMQMSHSVDDQLFYIKPDSTSFFQLLEKFASEPHIPVYQATSNGSVGASSLPLSKTSLPMKQVEEEEHEESTTTNCDTIEPAGANDRQSNLQDTLSTATPIDDSNEDSIFSANPERHFRRRKRRSSWTPTPTSHLSIDNRAPLKVDVIEKVNNANEEKSQRVTEHSPVSSLENLTIADNDDKKEETSEENSPSCEPITPLSRLRPRRLRYRSYRQPPASPEPVAETKVDFFLPTEELVPPTPSTPPPSPPPADYISSTNVNNLPGALKRLGSTGGTKKMVRFADSVGRQLAQVQYIRSLADNDSKDRRWSKSDMYVPTEFNFEPKPWSFDVALTQKNLPDTRPLKRFFCLYRQPVSEHPDIYLHEVWKSQIKLEHADIHMKPSSTNEQCLRGTVWVTNAGFWKNVTVKYSFNRWSTTYEYDAQHRCHSNDFRNIDQFEFNIDIPQDVDRIDFVLRYQVNGQEHWDNNEGRNYTIETESSTTPQTTISLPHDCDFNEMRFY